MTTHPPRFYCWNCDNTFVTWPHDRTGHVVCKWCGSYDVAQLMPRVTHGGRASVEAHARARAGLKGAKP